LNGIEPLRRDDGKWRGGTSGWWEEEDGGRMKDGKWRMEVVDGWEGKYQEGSLNKWNYEGQDDRLYQSFCI